MRNSNYMASVAFAVTFYLMAGAWCWLTMRTFGLFLLALSAACAWASCFTMDISLAMEERKHPSDVVFSVLSISFLATAIIFPLLVLTLV